MLLAALWDFPFFGTIIPWLLRLLDRTATVSFGNFLCSALFSVRTPLRQMVVVGMAAAAHMPLLSAPPLLSLAALDEQSAIFTTVELLRGHSAVGDIDLLTQAVWERQKIHPPLLGNQIALPHARTVAVTEIVFAVSRLFEPVPFGPEKIPVRLLFLFGVPPHRISEYLAATALLVRLLRDPDRSAALLSCADPGEFLAILNTKMA